MTADHPMTTREQREAEDAHRIELLRQAIQAGVDDMAGGRFSTFASSEALGRRLQSLATKALTSI